MDKFLALPTWLIVRVMLPLVPKKHIWKGRRFTLEDWHSGRTIFTKILDLCLWVSGGMICLFLTSSILLTFLLSLTILLLLIRILIL